MAGETLNIPTNTRYWRIFVNRKLDQWAVTSSKDTVRGELRLLIRVTSCGCVTIDPQGVARITVPSLRWLPANLPRSIPPQLRRAIRTLGIFELYGIPVKSFRLTARTAT